MVFALSHSQKARWSPKAIPLYPFFKTRAYEIGNKIPSFKFDGQQTKTSSVTRLFKKVINFCILLHVLSIRSKRFCSKKNHSSEHCFHIHIWFWTSPFDSDLGKSKKEVKYLLLVGEISSKFMEIISTHTFGAIVYILRSTSYSICFSFRVFSL